MAAVDICSLDASVELASVPRWVEIHLQLCFSKMVRGSEKQK